MLKKISGMVLGFLLCAVAADAAGLNLSWTDNSTDETGFEVERCQGASCTTFANIATVLANVVTFADAGLANNTTFCYRVRAVKTGATLSGYSNTACGTTPPPALPNAPTGLIATPVP